MGLKRRLSSLAGVAAVTSMMGCGPLAAHATETYGANTPSFYTIDAETYQLDRKLPQGCKCKQSGVSDANCEMFQCGCLCDLTAGMCDYNCCCDNECTADQVSRFEELGNCLPEGGASNSVKRCYSENELETINPRYPMTTDSTLDSTVDEMFCVVYDNSDVMGTFYSDPGYPTSSSVFSLSKGEKEFEYEDYVAPDDDGTSSAEDQYDLGVVMPAARSKGAGMFAAYGGYFPVPTAGSDGRCVETSYAGFMEPVRSPNSCLRITADLREDCETMFSVGRFSTELYVGVAPSSVTAETGGSTKACDDDAADDDTDDCTAEWKKVRVGSISYLDPLTGESSEVSSASDMNTTYVTGVCRNALKEITWTVVSNAKSTIDRVVADIVLTDVYNTNTSEPVLVSQDFAMDFEALKSYELDAKEYGNAVNRSRSGNPGYLSGLPLLSGTRNDYDSMDARVPGLEVMGSATDGKCPKWNGTMGTQTVNFGQDMYTGCVLSLTKDELEEMCDNSDSSPYMTANKLYTLKTGLSLYSPTYLNISDTHVGIFGNADPLDYTQWLAIDIDDSNFDYDWSADEQACKLMITSLTYKFLVAYVGSTDNPQAKIVAAQASYGREDVHFTDESSGTVNVLLSTTVSFVTYKESDYGEYAPPAPPILFTMPYDVFYPFSINAASSTTLSIAVVAVLVAVSSVALLIQ